MKFLEARSFRQNGNLHCDTLLLPWPFLQKIKFGWIAYFLKAQVNGVSVAFGDIHVKMNLLSSQ